jgi:hypothetical protein
VILFEVLPRDLPGGTEEYHRKPQDGQRPGTYVASASNFVPSLIARMFSSTLSVEQ